MLKDWKVNVPAGDAPLYERIADAVEMDVVSGRLQAGDRLPTHRALAASLSLATGTIAQAYAEAERRGLIISRVGRGSFIAQQNAHVEGGPAKGGPINMARNIPPQSIAQPHLREALARIARRPDLQDALEHSGAQGSLQSREAGAAWFRQQLGLPIASAGDLFQTNGSQHGLAIVMRAIVHRGGTVISEGATFYGLKMLSWAHGFSLHGVDVDAEGISPEGLERASATGARVVYLVPTLQNPTGISMSEARRHEIVAIARKHDLTIVEDDTYRAFATSFDMPPTLYELAPERTFNIATLSKVLTPSLRLGYVLPPTGGSLRQSFIEGISADSHTPPAYGGLIFDQWTADGSADAILKAVIAEAAQRSRRARDILGPALAKRPFDGLHLWMPLSPLSAERIAGRALRAGVEVTPPDAPIVTDAVSGLRICLGGAPNIEDLTNGLTLLAQSIASEKPLKPIAMV